MNRICLLGLPRCGSQYISSLIMINSDSVTRNLAEPFTPNHIPSLHDIGLANTSFNSYEDQVNAVIDKLRALDNTTSLVLKLFLHSWISETHHHRIIQVLAELKFKFVVVKRNSVIEQLLSLGIGLKLNKFTNFGDYDNTIVELDHSIMNSMKVLHDDLKNFDILLKNLNLDNCPVFHYETAKEDLSIFFKKTIINKTRYKRMSQLPSAKRISNINEVLNFLNLL
jgi:hypothetical protein